MHIKKLNYPKYNLLKDFQNLIEQGKIIKNKDNDQYCINTIPGELDCYNFGRGSLTKDWDASYYDKNLQQIVVPKRKKIYKENDFTKLVSVFKGTSFEEMYNYLNHKHVLGRVRIMISKPKTCLTWHVDFHKRIHYPMKTQEGCLMVIDKEVEHLRLNQWYYTNTLNPHTAINASNEDRIHLVATIISDK